MTQGKNKRSKPYTAEQAMKDAARYLPKTTAAASAEKNPHCGCRNHLRTPKQQFYSREAAVEEILRKYLKFGSHNVYPCPKNRNVFHIASAKVLPPSQAGVRHDTGNTTTTALAEALTMENNS